MKSQLRLITFSTIICLLLAIALASIPTDIPVPALVIFANPHSLSPWLNNNQDASARAAVKDYSSKFEAYTRKQENAIREAVRAARVITLPAANHAVFLSNEADVIREMRAFFTGLHWASCERWY